MADEKKGLNSNVELVLGDYKTAVKKLALPLMMSMFLMMAYNLADSIWVSGLGSDALAAIGFITPLFMIIIGLGNGIGAGTNSLIARYIGSKCYDQANNTAVHGLFLTVVISVVGAIFMYIALPSILIWMGAAHDLEFSLEYGYIIFTFMIVFLFNHVCTAILRSEGDVKRAMYATATTAIINIILDPIMIYVLGFGIRGAAYATVISASLSCIILSYWILYKKDTYLNVTLRNFKYKRSIIKRILNVTIPASTENLISSILMISINLILTISAGTMAVATYTATMRLIQLGGIPLIGFSTALLTIIGAAYGARNIQKIKDAYRYTIKLGLITTTIMVVVFLIFAPDISMIFAYGESSNIAPQIASAIRILVFLIYSVALGNISAMLYQGLGRGTTSLTLTIIRALICEIILAYLFAIVMHMGEFGVYLGLVIGGIIGGFISITWAMVSIRRLIRDYTPDPMIVDEIK
ncbi:MATE family efflux transporter [Methanosphaera cuniculi]|uniref:MATE family efflux transporter n=1 Tax=Methanosphaera cuniculi TaxID=1077256 RepID=UPI0026EB6975|nr:MATE family efflux transporter [Methanosphaera cuniculi]